MTTVSKSWINAVGKRLKDNKYSVFLGYFIFNKGKLSSLRDPFKNGFTNRNSVVPHSSFSNFKPST